MANENWAPENWAHENGRTRAFRRHQAERHLNRRLSEIRNQYHRPWHQADRWWDTPRARGRFKEQPQICACRHCSNARYHEGPPIRERRHLQGRQ